MRATLLALAVVLGLGGCALAQVAEPPYAVTESQGRIAIRDYDPMIVAEVTVTGARDAAANQGFRMLADYIFGNNVPKQKIEMTAPVTQAPAKGETIEMTAPVTQSGDGDTWVVRFVMPAQYTLETLPKPVNPEIRIEEVPAQRVAALTFSGFATAGALEERTQELKAYLAGQGYAASGPATYAFYNPPWTLPWARRNEILIPLEGQ